MYLFWGRNGISPEWKFRSVQGSSTLAIHSSNLGSFLRMSMLRIHFEPSNLNCWGQWREAGVFFFLTSQGILMCSQGWESLCCRMVIRNLQAAIVVFDWLHGSWSNPTEILSWNEFTPHISCIYYVPDVSLHINMYELSSRKPYNVPPLHGCENRQTAAVPCQGHG